MRLELNKCGFPGRATSVSDSLQKLCCLKTFAGMAGRRPCQQSAGGKGGGKATQLDPSTLFTSRLRPSDPSVGRFLDSGILLWIVERYRVNRGLRTENARGGDMLRLEPREHCISCHFQSQHRNFGCTSRHLLSSTSFRGVSRVKARSRRRTRATYTARTPLGFWRRSRC